MKELAIQKGTLIENESKSDLKIEKQDMTHCADFDNQSNYVQDDMDLYLEVSRFVHFLFYQIGSSSENYESLDYYLQ